MTDESNVLQVKDTLEELHKAFKEFTRAHVAYHDRLEDLYKIEESDEYFKSVQQSQSRLAGEILRWIVSSNGSDSNDRLEANVRDGIDDIAPSDSISNIGSRADSKHSRTSCRSRSKKSETIRIVKEVLSVRSGGFCFLTC